jgi:hypothetical protein
LLVGFSVPWEISIINGSVGQPRPLGTREEVKAAFAEALPGVRLQRPPIPAAEFLEQMPPVLRQAVMRPRLEADFESGDICIQFYANDEPVLRWVNGEVRGNGDPRPALAAICANRGWSVIDASDKSVVDLTAARIPAWDRFRAYRDYAIDQIVAERAENEQ